MKEKDRDIVTIHLCNTNDDHDVWFLRYGVQKNEFFIILDHFLLLSQ